ncbi:synaptonemal complex protein 3 [Oryzias latipes]|uniref:Synaptonemal complex protein 3 n=2 Tax=Oryzias latipes TaxID=8090 RepID=A0A3P9LA43_ORYLA|nr:synaptonemal complex protein 3 [Oryzias latipes]BAD36840.1 synaptonemal complex protein 3 [Oryzias latipes]
MESVRKVEKVAKKRSAAVFEEGADECAAGNEVQSMLEKFGADINKAMQVKQKHLECLTKNHMTGSQHKLEQLWSNYHGQRKKTTQQFSQRVSTAFQQWEAEAHRTEEQEEKLSNLFRQQQKVLQQARVAQNQKLKVVRELYDQFVKNMEEMEKSQNEFLQAAQEELKREMATLQKKLLMEAQQQEMATVRKSLQTMFF